LFSPNSTPAIVPVEDAGMQACRRVAHAISIPFLHPQTRLQELQMFYFENSNSKEQNMTVCVSTGVESVHLEAVQCPKFIGCSAPISVLEPKCKTERDITPVKV
jgi:hypothetical protein